MLNSRAPVALSALAPPTDPKPLPKYEPSSPKRALEVKDLLFKKLPLEIVNVVLEYAEYWPRTTVITGGRTTTVGYNGNVLIVSLGIAYCLLI